MLKFITIMSVIFISLESSFAQQVVSPPAKVESQPLAPPITAPPIPSPVSPPLPSIPAPQILPILVPPAPFMPIGSMPIGSMPIGSMPQTSTPAPATPSTTPVPQILPQSTPQQATPTPVIPPVTAPLLSPQPKLLTNTQPSTSAQPTIISPDPTNEPNILELNIEARPVLSLKDEASNEEGFTIIRRHIARLNEEAKKAGIVITGRPFAVIDLTDDQKFKFEVMLPIEKPVSNIAPTGLNFGVSPTGKAIRFKFSGAYDESAYIYESIEAYIEEKNIIARNYAIEEYLNDPKDGNDAELQMYIYYLRE